MCVWTDLVSGHRFGNLFPSKLRVYPTIFLKKSTNASYWIIRLDFAAAMFYVDVWFCYYTSVNVLSVCCDVV